MTLPDDYSRCNGVGDTDDGVWYWRDGCDQCLRRTSTRPDPFPMITPPKIIAFECEFLIENGDRIPPKKRIRK